MRNAGRTGVVVTRRASRHSVGELDGGAVSAVLKLPCAFPERRVASTIESDFSA